MSTPALLELADERIETARKELADIQFEASFNTIINAFAEPIRNDSSFCNSMTNLLVNTY